MMTKEATFEDKSAGKASFSTYSLINFIYEDLEIEQNTSINTD